ncbi:MAG: Hpt domain-containing protein [Proteobacteria bacterium]|nr:Hpt domain-containing protein [Pseudomonadota bacterium]
MNFKALGESLGLEEDEFIEIVEIFVETAVSDIKKLECALPSNDFAAVSDAAHSLKGSAGNLGFMDISRLSATIEDKARKNNITGLAPAIIELTALITGIKDQM